MPRRWRNLRPDFHITDTLRWKDTDLPVTVATGGPGYTASAGHPPCACGCGVPGTIWVDNPTSGEPAFYTWTCGLKVRPAVRAPAPKPDLTLRSRRLPMPTSDNPLAHRRYELGLSQQDLAVRLGVCQGTIAKAELDEASSRLAWALQAVECLANGEPIPKRKRGRPKGAKNRGPAKPQKPRRSVSDNLLVQKRHALGLTQVELAGRLGCHLMTISRAGRGKSRAGLSWALHAVDCLISGRPLPPPPKRGRPYGSKNSKPRKPKPRPKPQIGYGLADAKRVRELRITRRWSRLDLAKALGVPQPSVVTFERTGRWPAERVQEAIDLLEAAKCHQRASVARRDDLIAMRKELGLTQVELAGLLGKGHTTVDAWEKGHRPRTAKWAHKQLVQLLHQRRLEAQPGEPAPRPPGKLGLDWFHYDPVEEPALGPVEMFFRDGRVAPVELDLDAACWTVADAAEPLPWASITSASGAVPDYWAPL